MWYNVNVFMILKQTTTWKHPNCSILLGEDYKRHDKNSIRVRTEVQASLNSAYILEVSL